MEEAWGDFSTLRVKIVLMTPTGTTGTPLPTTNPVASLANQTVQDIFNDAVPVVEASVVTAQGWLGWPIIKQLWQIPFQWVVSQF